MYVKECIKDIIRIGGKQGRAPYLRLDMNENPGGLPKAFVEKVKEKITPEFLSTYPEENSFKEVLAHYLKVSTSNINLTNGSDMGIRYIFEIFAKQGNSVVTVSPSFEMYWVYCNIFGLKHRPVSYRKDFTIDINDILEAITDDTDIVVLLNPNNPIGTVYSQDEFERVAAKAEECNAVVVIDEAYHYFYSETFMDEALKRSNVILLRTFSKLFSMAGCRLGFMVSNAQVIEYIRHVRPTFEVNSLAILFGEAVLKEEGLIERLIEDEREGRNYLLSSLKEHGYETIAKEGNFIFFKPKTSVKHVSDKLEEEFILVKTYRKGILEDYIRITTGGKDYMKAFLNVLYKVDLE